MLTLLKEQPRAFYMIFVMELWERFGFYTVQGIFILYLMRVLGYTDVESYYTFGAFTALVYGLVLLGGYLGDQVLGTKRTIFLGLVVLLAGYTALALANSSQIFLALGLVCVGNGLFKANPSNLLSKCYAPQDTRLHGGFTLYYMSINIGSTLALILGPALSQAYGYSMAFAASALGLAAGLLNYGLRRKVVADINTEADKKIIKPWQWLLLILLVLVLTGLCSVLLKEIVITKWILIIVTALTLLRYGYFMSQESRVMQKRMLVALILIVEGLIFFVLYQQMPSSLNLFAVNNVISNIGGLHFDPQTFQVLNPFWIIIMSPVLAYFYRRLSRDNIRFSIAHKFALGMTLCGISFFLLYFARFFCNAEGMIGPGWMVASYFFQSTGELLVSALGLAMVAELVPIRIVGFVMGAWFLTSALAGYLGAYLAAFTALPEQVQSGSESLMIYTSVFGSIGLITLGISLLMWLAAPLLNKFITTSQPINKTDSIITTV